MNLQRDSNTPDQELFQPQCLTPTNVTFNHVENERRDMDYKVDSAICIDDTSSTTSIDTILVQPYIQNGREYPGFRRSHIFPSDEKERDRHNLLSQLCKLTLGGKLYLAPLDMTHLVLDVCTHTGIWAIDFANDHGQTKVIGIDLSQQQPTWIPPNLCFQIDLIEEPWTFGYKFDYIHGRFVIGSFKNWTGFFQQSFENLQSSGWLEIQDIGFPIQCDDDSMPPDCHLARWCNLMMEAATKLGRPLDISAKTKGMMEEAGFVDVVCHRFKWPQNTWPKDKRYKVLGAWTLTNFVDGIEAMSLALFTRGLGWALDETNIFLQEVQKDMTNRRIHAYWDFLTLKFNIDLPEIQDNPIAEVGLGIEVDLIKYFRFVSRS